MSIFYEYINTENINNYSNEYKLNPEYKKLSCRYEFIDNRYKHILNITYINDKFLKIKTNNFNNYKLKKSFILLYVYHMISN